MACWCRGEALKVKKPPLRLSSRNECYPSPIFKPSLGRREIYPPVPLPSRRDWKEKHYLYQGARTRNSHSKLVESKSKLATPFSFLLKIYSALQNSQITVYFFAGGNLLRNKTKGGKMSSREKSSEVDLTNQLPPRH